MTPLSVHYCLYVMEYGHRQEVTVSMVTRQVLVMGMSLCIWYLQNGRPSALHLHLNGLTVDWREIQVSCSFFSRQCYRSSLFLDCSKPVKARHHLQLIICYFLL